MNFKLEYESRIQYIDQYIENFLNNLSGVEDVLIDGMKYAVLNGGKRLRSILCTEFCYAFSGDRQAAMPYATAIELIHAYSLVHDDLPAMDNADFRRGLPSCHKKFGEDMGILIGDALLNCAFEIMLNLGGTSPNHISAMKSIAHSSGVFGMVNGQAKDLSLFSSSNVGENELLSLIEQKTMALIRGAATAGAYVGGCNSNELKIVDKYAYHLGLAFQIRDDFEDYEEDQSTDHACPNFINILGAEKAMERLQYNCCEMDKHLEKIGNCEFLKELNKFLFPQILI